MEFYFTDNPSPEEVAALLEGISQNALEKKGQDPISTFGYFLKDEIGKIRGGCSGVLLYGCLHIDSLWIDPEIQNNGEGKNLMKKMEEYAKQSGCHMMSVNTMDWEALPFYQKFGFTIDFERNGYTKNSTLYCLSKKL